MSEQTMSDKLLTEVTEFIVKVSAYNGTPRTLLTEAMALVPRLDAAREQEKEQAHANIRFLQQHPEAENVYSAGVLTRRIGGEHYEQFRYLDGLSG